MTFTIDGPGLGRGGWCEMLVDGKPVGRTRLEKIISFKFSPEGGAIGHDTGTPLTSDYHISGAYDGALRSVTVDLEPVQTSEAC
jgi:hypothetical protein